MLVAEHESVQTDDVLSKSAAVLWMSDLCCLRSAHCLISADTFITRIDQALTKAEVEEFPGSGPSRAKCKPKSICSVCLVIPHQISGVLWFISAANGDKRPTEKEIKTF